MAIFHKAICSTPGCNSWKTAPLLTKKAQAGSPRTAGTCQKCGGNFVVSGKYTIQWYGKGGGKNTRTFNSADEALAVHAKIDSDKRLEKLAPQLHLHLVLPTATPVGQRAEEANDATEKEGSTPFDVIANEFHKLHSTEIKDTVRERIAVDHLIRFFGDTPIGKILQKDLMGYRTHREDQTVIEGKVELTPKGKPFKRKKKPRNVCAATVGRELSVMRQIIKFACKNRYIFYRRPEDHPFHEYSLPVSRKVDHIITHAEFEELLNHLPPSLHPLIKFLRESACRVSEAMQLTWKRVEKLMRRAKLKDTKTSKAQGDVETLFLSPMAWAIINAQPKVCKYVFFNPETKTRWKNIGATFRRAAIKAELVWDDGPLRPHDLRHNLLTEIADTDVSSSTLMAISRHKDSRSLERYLHRDKGNAADQAFQRLADSRCDQGQTKEGDNPVVTL